MKEISSRLWVGVDYQGGRHGLGAVSFGLAWAFTDQISVLVGYDLYIYRALAGRDTLTVQLDINFARLVKARPAPPAPASAPATFAPTSAPAASAPAASPTR
jgi:hypothetical protein